MKNNQFKPNRFAEFLMRLSFRTEDLSYRLGDLEEAYQLIAEKDGKKIADKWYWQQVLGSLPHNLNISFFWGTIMFKNYFKIALRNIQKNKIYSFINIFGLAIGLAVAIIIFRWTQDEFSTNQFHEKINNIYKVQAGYKNENPFNGAPPMVAPSLKKDYQDVIEFARVRNGREVGFFSYGNKNLKEPFYSADYSLFDIFSFPFVEGSVNKESKDVYQIVISERVKEKYFGDKNALGEILRLNNKHSFKVVAVMKNPPENSTLRMEMIVPLEFQKIYFDEPGLTETWYNCSFNSYVLLSDKTNPEEFAKKIRSFIQVYKPDDQFKLHLNKFADLYLYTYGRIDRIRLFQLIGILILVVACINFMNLSTARSAKRAKEVGLRKVVGAVRKQLVYQFLGESIIITFISFILATIFILVFVPLFNNLAGKNYHILDFAQPDILIGVGVILLVTSLFSGSYPAFYLSSFIPGKVLKGEKSNSSKNKYFRTAMVIAQFTITIVLIIFSTTIYRQINFMKDKNLGFEKDQVIHFQLEGNLQKNYKSIKNELLKNSNISDVTVVTNLPTGIYWNTQGVDWESKDPEYKPHVSLLYTDHDYAKTLGMKIKEGEFFNGVSSEENAVVINEAFTKILNWDSYIGRQLQNGDNTLIIKGIVSDFHFKPLYNKIEPLMIFNTPEYQYCRTAMAKISPVNIESTIADIKNKLQKFAAQIPFEYSFLDETFDRLYRYQSNHKNIIQTFTFLAILISCLGLFGLAAFMAEQRTKEIGVRKVMGASVKSIMMLLSKEFTKWVIVANFIAIPIGYYYADGYLSDFAYRIDLGWFIFLISAVIALAVALLTVSFQTYKAATSNPINSLRSE